MNDITVGYSLIMLLGVFIASVAQVLLKKAAMNHFNNTLKQYLNAKVIIAYFMMFVSTVCTLLAYRVIPLSLGMVIDSSGYIFVTFFGFFFFKESITRRRIIALIFIVTGIGLYAYL